MRRLVTRYIHQMKKQRRQDGVNEDDLLEIKQDISSLRYDIQYYQSSLILTALLYVDLINVAFLRHLPLSGHHDVALFE